MHRDVPWIRLARPDEAPRLREIEDAAGALFSGLRLIDETLDVSFPLDELLRLVGLGQVWVGCREDGSPSASPSHRFGTERPTSRRWTCCRSTAGAGSGRACWKPSARGRQP